MERFNQSIQYCHLWATNGITFELNFSWLAKMFSSVFSQFVLNEYFPVIEDMNKSELGIVTQIRHCL